MTEPQSPLRRLDAVTWLTLYVVLLFGIPSALVLGQFGSAGAPSMLVGLCSLLIWFSYQLSRPTATGSGHQPLRVSLGAFILSICISYLLAMLRPIDSDEISPADVALLSCASWAGTLLLANDLIGSRDRFDALVRRLVAAGALLGSLGLLQFITGAAIVDRISIPGLTNSGISGNFIRQGFVRPSGTATHPIEFGVLLTALLPLCLHWGFHGQTRSFVLRWWPTAAVSGALMVSFSRSAYLGAAVALLVLLVGWPRRRRRNVMIGASVVFAVAFVAVPRLFGSITGLFAGASDDPSIHSRTDSYAIAREFFWDSPLFGRGLGTFLPKYRILDNQYLLLLVSVGIVGAFAFVGMLAVSILIMARVRRASSSSATRDLALAYMAGVGAAATSLLFFDAFAFPMTMGTLFLLLGMSGALARLSSQESAEASLGGRRFRHIDRQVASPEFGFSLPDGFR